MSNPNKLKTNIFEKLLTDQSRKIFSKFLEQNAKHAVVIGQQHDTSFPVTQCDEMIIFRQLKGRAGVTEFDISEEVGSNEGLDNFMSEIKKDIDTRVQQLTGYSDPIYAEAFVEVHHYDILLKIILANRTNRTLPGVQLELLTQGSLKIVDKPMPITLRAWSSQTLKASLKVSSTDNGAIYGYLTYDSASGNIPHIININEIQIDFINELQPADLSEMDFKKKWIDYEWENKVQVSTKITNLKDYIEYFAEKLNVRLMTKISE